MTDEASTGNARLTKHSPQSADVLACVYGDAIGDHWELSRRTRRP